MRIRLISDVHFEFYEDGALFFNKGEDVLVIAGDLAVGPNNVIEALRRFRDIAENVIYVPGNHEYYGNNIAVTNEVIAEFCKGTNIRFLNPGTVEIGGVAFIGATLWSNFGNDPIAQQACSRAINDFNRIKGFSTGKCAELYEQHAAYIQANAVFEKQVIVTHFLPDGVCTAAEFRGEYLINKYFANNLGNYIAGLEGTTWLYGHTHTPGEITIGTTPVICNPYGYYKNANYKERFICV